MKDPATDSVIDTLVATLSTIAWSMDGQVAGLIEKPEPGRHVPTQEVKVVEGFGFSGDHPRKSFWKGELIPGREVTAISSEVAAILGFDPKVAGDNLVTSRIDLSSLQPGSTIAVGSEVVLRRSLKLHRPCELFKARTSDVAYSITLGHNYRGALFTVVSGGQIRIGDHITVVASPDSAADPAASAVSTREAAPEPLPEL